ncbi:MAG: terminase small subunit [Alphaproteobacteria bacterium]
MPFDRSMPSATPAAPGTDPPRPSPVAAELAQWRRETDWKTAHCEWLPYWQKADPVPPPPETAPAIETPGDALSERQEAFCLAYVEQPVGPKAAVAAGYSPVNARQQANRLLKHPLVVRRIHALRELRGLDRQVRRDTIIDQAEAVFEAAMEKGDYYAAMQALTMKARLAGFADFLPGVRILRRDPREFEQEFWARSHAAEQRLMAVRLGEIANAVPDGVAREQVREGQRDAEMFAEGAESAARQFGQRAHDAAERIRARR